MDLSSGIAVLEEGGGCPIFEVLIRCHPPCLFQRGAGNFKMVIYTSTIFKLKSTKQYFQIYKIENHQFSPLTLFLFSSPTFSMYFSSSVTQLCPTLRPHGLWPHQAPLSMGFSRQEYWGGQPFPSPGDFQGSNLGLPHCRQIPYCLSHQGSPGHQM